MSLVHLGGVVEAPITTSVVASPRGAMMISRFSGVVEKTSVKSCSGDGWVGRGLANRGIGGRMGTECKTAEGGGSFNSL